MSESAESAEHGGPFALFEANLAAFKACAPHLAGRLAAIERPNTELVVDAAGRIDINFRGQGFYDGDAVAYANRQLERYLAEPLRHAINQPDPEKLEGACGDFCHAVTDRLAGDGIVYDPRTCPTESHMLMVFGVGLGLHVAPLIEHSAARVVVLVEPNLEFLYQSLFVIEWHALLDDAAREGRRIRFVVERDSAAIAARGRQILRANNPALLDGVYLYNHYPSVVLDQARDRLREELFLILTGLGFFEDEMVMLRNAADNLCRGPAEILSAFHRARHEPLFIVGSGPSVERDLDFIAEHTDRAVVVSIGTGLRVLLQRGLRPDFHVELENGEANVEIIKATAADHDLAGITLIASLTVQPALAALFDRRLLFFRERVSSTMVFGAGIDVLQPAGPTVANAGLVAAVRLGFRTVYLFGVDMGTKAAGRFHAEGSVYGAGLRAEVAKPTGTLAGNFGGEATGEGIFDWSRKVLEGLLATYRNLTVYNCSDGARIAGAIPKVARAVTLAGAPLDRAALAQSLAAGIGRYDAERLHGTWREADCPKEATVTFGRIGAVLAHAAAAPEPDLDWIHEVYDIVRDDGDGGVVAKAYLSGTLTLCLGCANWYDRRVTDPEARRRCRRILLDEFTRMLQALETRLEDFFEEIDRQIAGA